MTRILVTGGAGYVGSVSVEAFLAAGHDVVVLDDLSTGHRSAVTPGARLEVGSYVDQAATTTEQPVSPSPSASSTASGTATPTAGASGPPSAGTSSTTHLCRCSATP